MENYLETVLALEEDHGHAHVRDIAARIKIKMPSVTQALSKLKKAGLVNYNRYDSVTLTGRGRTIARRFMKDHRTLAYFFREILKVPPAVAKRMPAGSSM